MDAKSIAKALRGRPCGSRWMACCPAHHDRTPSLSIRRGEQGNVLVHCFGGCGQDEVLAALRAMGLWPEQSSSVHGNNFHPKPVRKIFAKPENPNGAFARRIWSEAKPAEGSLVESYLRSRGLRMPRTPFIRFHPQLRHPSGAFFPCMVALPVLGTNGSPTGGIHRTFLAPDGHGKAPVNSAKMTLGPCKGGAVRLAEPESLLMIGEGIETCLSAMQATGYPAWAAGSSTAFMALDLPVTVRDVIVLADGDDGGLKHACACALRWAREGRAAKVAYPGKGRDFNNLLIDDYDK